MYRRSPKIVDKPNLANFAWTHRPYWEACERRLALSAMPWMPFDVHPIEPLDLPGSNDLMVASQPLGPNLPTESDTPGIGQHLSEAHNQTGWNQVHSQYGLTGSGQTVAVIDSGIAFDHVALGKGYGPGYRVVGGWDFAENDARPYDDAPAGFHGTHVAGIIGADDGTHQGVAPDVDLVALRVFNDAGKGELAWAENALKWVHDNRNAFENPITTVNLSLGAAWNSSSVPTWGTLEEELGQLQRDGIVVVVSAGNSFQQNKTPGLSYPAASPFVIPVSSIDANGQLSDFSQRDSRSIAAPGRSIESTVPDYFYGKDGIANDWATASGTSMAAPYIAGASVLVREVMEMAGVQNITPQSIYEQLRSTANSVWDSVTQQNYSVLDLDRAIESLLPKDVVGDSLSNSQLVSLQNQWQTDGWLNTLSDQDVYRIEPTQNGTISIEFDSDYVLDADVSLLRGNNATALHETNGKLTFSVNAGESIGLSVSDLEAIGPYHLNWSFTATATSGGSGNSGSPGSTIPTNAINLGQIDVLEQSLIGTSRYQLTAEHTGLLSVVVDAGQSPTGTLQILRSGNSPLTDNTVENNQWRIDLNVTQGQSVEFVLPDASNRNVHIVNLLQQSGDQATIFGTEAADRVSIDLGHGITANIAGVSYQLDSNTIKTLTLDGQLNNDTLSVIGSTNAEQAELKPGLTTVTNAQLAIRASNFENVQFVGGGGPDRAYLYDAATDDRLNIWPNKAELTGVGYAFQVEQINRIFVHALQGGDDQAFVFDSAGDDQLSVRPQFTSLSGPSYFNYVSGFERVFAYANAGGTDNASLYDSAGNDLYSSSGEVTSIVGSGFSTFARGFENVEAFANAGGVDRATIYAPTGGKLTSGPDYVGMQDSTKSSVARNFEKVEAFSAGVPVPTPAYTSGMSVQSEATALPQSLESDSSDSAPTTNAGAAQSRTPIENSSDVMSLAPMVSTVEPTTSTSATRVEPSSESHPLQNETMDWISGWIENELRPQPSQFDGVTQMLDERKHKLNEIDLSWADAAHERAVLDAIFAKH